MMRKKRWILGIGVACLMVSFLASIGATGKPEATAAEPMEITWLARITSGEDTTWAIQEIDEKFNVRILPNGIDTNDKEKLSVMLAAGEFPDCGSMHDDPYRFYNEGVTRGIPIDFIRKNMPNYARMLDRDFPEGWLMNKSKDKENEYINLTGISIFNLSNGYYIGFRSDWVKNLGFELPNYEQKKISLDTRNKNYFLDEDVTLDWLERLLIAFRDGDADGNGKIDTIPWASSNNFIWTWQPLMGAFGIAFDYNLMDNGTLYEWCIAPGYKEFLKLAAKWYTMGLIDREFVSLDTNKGWEKVTNGLVGVSTVMTDYIELQRPPNNFATDEEAAEGVQVVILPPPTGPTGLHGGRAWAPVTPLSYNFMTGKKVGDEKLKKILQILEWMKYGGDESWIVGFRGKEGVHFDWKGEPWNSPAIARKPEDVPAGYPKIGGFPSVYPASYTPDKIKFLMDPKYTNHYVTWMLVERGQEYTRRPYRWDLFAETNITEVNMKYKDTLKTIYEEFSLKAIIGEVDIDAEWDGYVAKWRKSGGDAVLAEYQKAPIVSELRKGKTVY